MWQQALRHKTEVLNSSQMTEQSTEGRVGFARCHQLLISWQTPSSDEQIMASDGDASNSSGLSELRLCWGWPQ